MSWGESFTVIGISFILIGIALVLIPILIKIIPIVDLDIFHKNKLKEAIDNENFKTIQNILKKKEY